MDTRPVRRGMDVSLLPRQSLHSAEDARGSILPWDSANVDQVAPTVAGIDVPTESGSAPDARSRHFLLVFGPFGPFTSRLGKRLRHAGARCSRVILNAGDLLDWGPRHGLPYFGSLHGWPDWLRTTIRRERVTDIILYGDAHPYCVEAGRVAAQMSIAVHVMEQGYFRPFWITLERNGVNANSSLPRDPEAYRRAAPEAPTPDERWLPPLTPPAAWNLFAYHAVLWLGTPAFPFFRLPYQYSLPRQALGHARRYLDQRLLSRRHRAEREAALDTKGPVFLAVLQRPGDSQLRLHSPFTSVAEFIERVISSFAGHATADARLIFNAHPLDHGVDPHGRVVSRLARAFGIADRVFFLDRGDIRALMPSACGAVTVNSTAGLSAIQMGLPTIVLGEAIYDMPGLTHQSALDTFWTAPEPPDPALYDAFRRVVIARAQIGGAYATVRGVEMAAPEVTRRLLARAHDAA